MQAIHGFSSVQYLLDWQTNVQFSFQNKNLTLSAEQLQRYLTIFCLKIVQPGIMNDNSNTINF